MFQLHSVPGKLLPHSCGYVLSNLKTKRLCIYVSNNESRRQRCLKSKQEVSVSVPGAVLRQRRSAWGLAVFHKE